VTPDDAETLEDRDAHERQRIAASPYLDLKYSTERAPHGTYPDRLARLLVERFYHRPGRLLDLGCGRGDHLAAFARLGFDVAGVDISERSRELAGDFAVEVVDLDRDRLPFPPESFDFVFSKSVVEHIRNTTTLLANVLEILRPGGVAVVLTPSWEHTYKKPFYYEFTHVRPFTAPSLAEALTLSGFEHAHASHFYQLPLLWERPALTPLTALVRALPLPYRPYDAAPWPASLNKLIRFSNEVMVLGTGTKPR